MLSELFTSNTRAEVMRMLFNGLGEEHYLRDLEKLSSVKINSLHKEVKRLVSLDLLKVRQDGNRTYYSANQQHPIYPDLVSIVEKTVGLYFELTKSLSDSAIRCAFIFGSFASGKEKAQSDIDLVIIGDLGMRRVSKLLSGLEERIGREINPHIFSEEEFKERIRSRDHFISSVMDHRVKVLIGNIDEYR